MIKLIIIFIITLFEFGNHDKTPVKFFIGSGVLKIDHRVNLFYVFRYLKNIFKEIFFCHKMINKQNINRKYFLICK